MLLKEGARVKAGDELFFSKYADQTRFVSPVSGLLKEIVRGAKRRILEVIIEADKEIEYKDFGSLSTESASSEDVKAKLLRNRFGGFHKAKTL